MARGRRGPEEPGEFAGDGDRGDVGRFATRLEAFVNAVQAVLRFPRDLQDVVRLPLLAAEQRLPDPRVAGVVPSRLDQQPSGDARPGFGDRSLVLALAGLIQRRRQPEPATQLPGRGEPRPVTNELEMQRERAARVQAPERWQP